MKRKKIFLLVLSVLMMCGCTKSDEKKEVVVSQQEEAWQLFMSSIDKLQSHDQITIYDVIGTQDGAHDDYDSEEVNGKNIMTSLKYYYNLFVTKAVVDNIKKETTYTNAYATVGEIKSEQNKLFTKIKDEDNENADYRGWVEISKEPTTKSAKEIVMPYLEKMKKNELNLSTKYIVSDGNATAWSQDKLKYEALSILENNKNGINQGQFPVLYSEYVDGLINIMKKSEDFDKSWILLLADVTRTTLGTELPSKNYCSIRIDKRDNQTVINYSIDKESAAYKESMKILEENTEGQDLSWNTVQYFDDVSINITIDKDGNLKSMEFANRIAFLNEGIKDFRIPQYILVEFEYK